MKKKNEGIKCNYCGELFGKVAIKRHLEKCEVRKEKTQPGEEVYYWVQVQGYYQKEYCMYLDVSAKASLKDLDQFLRDRWLECCGHLSRFRIEGKIYDSDPDPDNMFGRNKSMKVKLNDVLYEGLEFIHEYDFGSTTVLKLKVISTKTGAKRKEKVILMARNLPPEFVCVECGRPAVQLCSCCIYKEDAFYCTECGEEHECGEDMMLPVVNSPRMGVCGYCGEKG